MFITENPVVVNAVNLATKGFASLATSVADAADSFNDLFRDEEEKGRIKTLGNEIDVARKKLVAYQLSTGKGGADEFTTQGKIFRDQIPILEKLIVGLERRKKLLEETKSENDDGGGGDTSDKELARKNMLAEKLKVIGLSQVEQLRQQEIDKQAILDESRERDVIGEEEYLERKLFLQQEYANKISSIEQKRAEESAGFLETIRLSNAKFSDNQKANLQSLAKNLNSLAIKGYGNAFKAIGAALANGENSQQAFADAAKSATADAASAVGDYYILDGVGRIAKSYGTDSTGYQLVAAGSAMKVLAGALGASGGQPSASGGGESGAGGSFSDDSRTSLGEQDIEERQVGTTVNLTVEGSLVQQEELGAYIADITSESNQKNGNVVLNPRFA